MNNLNNLTVMCAFVAQHATHVSINDEAVHNLAHKLHDIPQKNWLSSAPYSLDNLKQCEKLHFILVFDAISFSYWSEPKWTIEYNGNSLDGSWGLQACIGRALEEGFPLLDMNYLSSITPRDFAYITRANTTIPLLEERVNNLRNIGTLLRTKYDSQFRYFIENCSNALDLVQKMSNEFSSFADIRHYRGKQISFCKRAQCVVGDIAQNDQHIKLQGFDQLTACSDYKLPQLLRHNQALNYSPSLTEIVDDKKEITAGSEYEVEIRGCTIECIRRLTKYMNETSVVPPASSPIHCREINDMIWLLSQEKIEGIKPYHRTRTTSY